MFKNFLNVKSVLILLLLVVYFFKATVTLDPDFGWRLRTGMVISENGVPKADIYSYTMPSFHWVDHAWLTDAVIYTVYKIRGIYSTGLLFSILAILALLISASQSTFIKIKGPAEKMWYFGAPAFLLAAGSLLPFSGIRVQIMTWLMLSVFFLFIFNQRLWKRFRYFAPLFFLLWANLHGGFASGLSIFFVVFLIRSIKDRKVDLIDFLILTLSTLVTFVNPYGAGVYREIWSSISDNSLRFEIIEWQPAFLSFDIPSISLAALSSILIIYYRKKIGPEKIVVFFLLLFQGISSIRHFPLWVLISLPVTLSATNFLYEEVYKNKVSKIRFEKAYYYFWLYTLLVLAYQIIFAARGAIYLSEKNSYPVNAVTYIKSNLADGEIFSEYLWGGYLIWKLPERKVFIDGRMPSWNNSRAPGNESADAMKDYLAIMKGKEDYKGFFEKYHITTVLWQAPKPQSLSEYLDDKYAGKFSLLYKFFGYEKNKFSLAEKLSEDGWKKIYQDNIAVVYSRP